MQLNSCRIFAIENGARQRIGLSFGGMWNSKHLVYDILESRGSIDGLYHDNYYNGILSIRTVRTSILIRLSFAGV